MHSERGVSLPNKLVHSRPNDLDSIRLCTAGSEMQIDHLLEAGGENSHTMRRYGLAIVAAIFALWLRQLLFPVLGADNPYHTAWAAVVFSAWYCGVGPSIITALLSVLGIWYFFVPPFGSFGIQDPKTAISGMVGFLAFSGVIIALGETNRRSLAASKSTENRLKEAHDELEQKVLERTAALNAANANLGELSSRLQQMRDEERRQIARELHDSIGQLLAALAMNTAVVQRQADNLDSAGARAVSENAAMVEQISREIRTISHLLHPPLLDVAGLASALRWYVDGFSERSQIKVDLQIPEPFRRLSDEMEIAIFRMIQECLTNIHRHSGGSLAAIRVHEEDHRIVVEVQDGGKGIPLEKQLELSSSGRTGVGFRGMRERLRQFGGTLEIRSDNTGTAVTATLPLADATSAQGEKSEVA
jgi:signal transduction histidine kinase